MKYDKEESQLLEHIKSISTWRRGNERAPHKPLLLLLALARAKRQDLPRLSSFKDLEPQIRTLLERYGRPRRAVHPEYPFWHLQGDHLWDVPGAQKLAREFPADSPSKTFLMKNKVVGGFPAEVYKAFQKKPGLVTEAARMLLHAHFPESLHAEILNDVGLDLDTATLQVQRDPRFREEVLNTYEHCCVICGQYLKLSKYDLALDAAHVKWVQYDGPDEVQNGLALCAVHHRAFDGGGVGLTSDLRILISSRIEGHGERWEWFKSFHGLRIRKPNILGFEPKGEYIGWHQNEVFRGPPRS